MGKGEDLGALQYWVEVRASRLPWCSLFPGACSAAGCTPAAAPRREERLGRARIVPEGCNMPEFPTHEVRSRLGASPREKTLRLPQPQQWELGP